MPNPAWMVDLRRNFNCRAWLCDMMHTTDIDSAVGCKSRSFTAHPGVFLRNFYYLILQCAVWLCGVVHIVELDSAVWCTSWRLTPRWDAQHRAWLCTMEFFEKFWLLDSAAVWYMPWSLMLDSSVGCTPWSLTLLFAWHRRVRLLQKCQFFRVFVFFTSLKNVLSKNSWSNKDSLHNMFLFSYYYL